MLSAADREGPEEEREIPPEWEQAAARVAAAPGVALLLGASDTGKSTLARYLAERWRRAGRRVGLVDADLGQSWIGPPTTVGLALFSPDLPPPSPLVPDALEFVGVTSPPGRFLAHVLGTQAVVREALARGAEIVVVDTTGLAVGPVGASLKRHKLRALEPRHVLALQRGDELEPILRLSDRGDAVTIHRLPVPARVQRRSPAARRAAREARFHDYFAPAVRRDLPWASLRFSGLWLRTGRRLEPDTLARLEGSLHARPLYGEVAGDAAVLLVRGDLTRAGVPEVRAFLQVAEARIADVDALRGVLLGLRDAGGRLLALGILEELDAARERVRILAPPADAGRIREIEFGRLRIDPGGRELGEVRWR